jgi:hypothetical protein
MAPRRTVDGNTSPVFDDESSPAATSPSGSAAEGPILRSMLIEALLLDPPDGDLCFTIRFTNDSDRPIQSVFVDRVEYEWADISNTETVGARFGPIALGASVELMRETSTEVRTSIILHVDDGGGPRAICAELGKLYASRGARVATLCPMDD